MTNSSLTKELTALTKEKSSMKVTPDEQVTFGKKSARTEAMCHNGCGCSICKITTANISRMGQASVLRPFVEEGNFRRFESSTKSIENHINMNNLDSKTKQVIRYY